MARNHGSSSLCPGARPPFSRAQPVAWATPFAAAAVVASSRTNITLLLGSLEDGRFGLSLLCPRGKTCLRLSLAACLAHTPDTQPQNAPDSGVIGLPFVASDCCWPEPDLFTGRHKHSEPVCHSRGVGLAPAFAADHIAVHTQKPPCCAVGSSCSVPCRNWGGSSWWGHHRVSTTSSPPLAGTSESTELLPDVRMALLRGASPAAGSPGGLNQTASGLPPHGGHQAGACCERSQGSTSLQNLWCFDLYTAGSPTAVGVWTLLGTHALLLMLVPFHTGSRVGGCPQRWSDWPCHPDAHAAAVAHRCLAFLSLSPAVVALGTPLTGQGLTRAWLRVIVTEQGPSPYPSPRRAQPGDHWGARSKHMAFSPSRWEQDQPGASTVVMHSSAVCQSALCLPSCPCVEGWSAP